MILTGIEEKNEIFNKRVLERNYTLLCNLDNVFRRMEIDLMDLGGQNYFSVCCH